MSDDPNLFVAAGLDEVDLEEIWYGPLDEILAAALAHARRGRPVFPLWWPVWTEDGHVRCACPNPACDRIGKHPRNAHGLKDATRERDAILAWWRRWPRANIGVPTGGARFDVLDVDPDKGGAVTLAELEQQHGPLPATAETLTGGGGRHLLFRPSGLRNSTSLIGPGLDIRGDGGYIVVAPSVHQSCRRYEPEVLHALDAVPLADMPAWLRTLASAEGRGDPGAAAPVEPTIPEGQRNGTLTSMAGTMRRRGADAPVILAALREMNVRRCHPPLPEDEVSAIAATVARYAPEMQQRAIMDHARDVAGWRLYDGAHDWDFPAIAELIDAILPATGIVWWGGLPKRYKSLFALYCSLAIACRRSAAAKKFLVRAFPKILYVAREDGGARLKERRNDILSAWTERPDPGAIIFVIRPRLDLLNPEHVDWLRETCMRLGITMLVLDTWTALSPGADPLGAKDQAQLAAVVVRLCEDIGGLVVVVDHSRKNRPDGQPLSSADIFGPPQKWAAAEHIVMLDVVETDRRLEVFIEGKDMETRRFFLTVSARGSGEEKFTFAGSVEGLAQAQHAVGDANLDHVLSSLRSSPEALSTSDIVKHLASRGVKLSPDTIQKHAKRLLTARLAQSTGRGPTLKYFALDPSPIGPSPANEDLPA